ncbi:MAG: bifunctional metallophosphatase/5'-nucleotidase [Deltaproteobacteria bacterium]|nr:bifunctional metallophosphatase/5'-nucleotidase [Deltaproteobacteria bacterium]
MDVMILIRKTVNKIETYYSMKPCPTFYKTIIVSFLVITPGLLSSCREAGEQYNLAGQDVRLTIIHTSDIHSRILPYSMEPAYTDVSLGLDPRLGPYGGAERIAQIVDEQRAKAGRCLYVDTGDVFQGAPVFNRYKGAVEVQFLSQLGVDVMVVGNEFDLGVNNLAAQMNQYKNFPLLAANYVFPPTSEGLSNLRNLVDPYKVFDIDGLLVGVIGMGDIGSITSLEDRKNSSGFFALDTYQTVQNYVDLLRSRVNLVIVASHMGLQDDIDMIRHTRDIDLVLGGHLHIVLNPPMVLPNADGKSTILMHSGAFGKYVGRLDLVIRVSAQGPGKSRVLAFKHKLFPVEQYSAIEGITDQQSCYQAGGDKWLPPSGWDKGACLERNATDGDMRRLLEYYSLDMLKKENYDRPVAFALEKLKRFGASGGDSALGNLVAESLQRRYLVETDFGLTNSLGIRTDIDQGPVTVEAMYNVFPFENTIVSMFLSGSEIQEMLDFVARKSAARGCSAQAQVSGVCFTMNCALEKAEDIRFPKNGEPCFDKKGNPLGTPLDQRDTYEVAVNDYIAGGGSGFRVLKANNTKVYTGISMRDAVIDYFNSFPMCGKDKNGDGKYSLDELEKPVQDWIQAQPESQRDRLIDDMAHVPCVTGRSDGRIRAVTSAKE